MSNILAIAYKLFQEARQSHTLVFFTVLMLLLLPFFPINLKSDDTLKSQIQLAITYSLILISMMLYLVSIFFSTYSFTQELKSKQYYLVDVKPVGRWQFFYGKFLGIALFNAIMLIILSMIGYCMIAYLGNQKQPDDPSNLEEIWISYRSISPEVPYTRINALVLEEYQKMKQENRLSSEYTEDEHWDRIRKKLEVKLQHIAPSFSKVWQFKAFPLELRDSSNKLRLRYRLFSTESGLGFLCKVRWEIGRGNSQYIWEDRIKPGEFHEFNVPCSVINVDGIAEVRFVHTDPNAGLIYFPLSDGLEILYPAEPFWLNYVKALLLIYLLSCFLIAIGLFASTFLSFAVSLFFGFFILLLGVSASFVEEITAGSFSQQNIWKWLSSISLQFIFIFVPNFDAYSQNEILASARVVEWRVIWDSIWNILFIRGGILSGLGCLIFQRREIGKPML